MEKKIIIAIIAIFIILTIVLIIFETSLKDNKNPGLIIEPTPAKEPLTNTTNTTLINSFQSNNLKSNDFEYNNFQCGSNLCKQKKINEQKDILFDEYSQSCIFVGDINGLSDIYPVFYGNFYNREISGKNINVNIDCMIVNKQYEDVIYIHVFSFYISGIYRFDTSNIEKGWELIISTGSNINNGYVSCQDTLDKCRDSKITDLIFNNGILYITTPSIIYKYIEGLDYLEIFRYNNKSTLGFDILNNDIISINIDSEIEYNNSIVSKGTMRPSFVKFLNDFYYVYIDENKYIISNSYDNKDYNTDYIKSFSCSDENILIIEETGEVILIKNNGIKELSRIKFDKEIKVSNNHVVSAIGNRNFYIISTYTEGITDENWYIN